MVTITARCIGNELPERVNPGLLGAHRTPGEVFGCNTGGPMKTFAVRTADMLPVGELRQGGFDWFGVPR